MTHTPTCHIPTVQLPSLHTLSLSTSYWPFSFTSSFFPSVPSPCAYNSDNAALPLTNLQCLSITLGNSSELIECSGIPSGGTPVSRYSSLVSLVSSDLPGDSSSKPPHSPCHPTLAVPKPMFSADSPPPPVLHMWGLLFLMSWLVLTILIIYTKTP